MWQRTLRLGWFVGCLVFALLTGTSCSAGPAEQVESPPDVSPQLVQRDAWGEIFAEEDAVGTFVLREVGTDVTYVWDQERASERRRPASTFKILNSLIILETGVLPDTAASVPWDGVDRGVASWNVDHSLRSGIEVSAVWAYQHLAREVGEEQMSEWVERAAYGNRQIGGGIDQFWLTGDLRISPIEQLDFLERFVTDELPFRPEVVAAVGDILVREQGEGWAWSHKTGTALAEEPQLGWLVGITEHDDRTFVFAMNLDLAPVTDVDTQLDPELRQRLARRILEHEAALPQR